MLAYVALTSALAVCLRVCICDHLYVRINRNPYSVTMEWNWFHGINGSPALSDPRHLVRVAYCTDNRINGVPRNVTRCDLRETEGPRRLSFCFAATVVAERNSFVENWLDRRNDTEINAPSLCNLLSTPAIKARLHIPCDDHLRKVMVV